MLKFYDTTIRFKAYFSYHMLRKEPFTNFCTELESFPFNKNHPDVVGLYLGGDRYFRKILFKEAKDVSPEEVEKIKSITPIIEQGYLPYVLEQNYFEVRIPTKDSSFEKLMDSVDEYDKYLDDLLESNTGKKIEIHMRGALGKQLSRLIFYKAIPQFVDGNYHYYTLLKNEEDEGETYLPTEIFEELPENIRRLVDVIRDRYSLKLIRNKDKFILKPVTKLELGVSLYSDQNDWFKGTLEAFKNADVFETAVSHIPYTSLPHLTGSLR